jgi:hypothetical protein
VRSRKWRDSWWRPTRSRPRSPGVCKDPAPTPVKDPAPAPTEQDAKRARRDRLHALLAKAREISPVVFVGLDDPPLPLSIGFAAELVERGFVKTEVRALLSWWCTRPEYHTAVAGGGRRVHFDGADAGGVTDADHEHAAGKLAARSSS